MTTLPTETAAPPDEPLDAIFAALASPTRRRLLSRLAEGDQPVGALAAPFAMSRPAVSQHLRVLLEAGLVSEQRAGRAHLYRLEPERLRTVREWLHTYEHFWRAHLGKLGDYLDEEES